MSYPGDDDDEGLGFEAPRPKDRVNWEDSESPETETAEDQISSSVGIRANDIVLAPQQAEAMDAVGEWLQNREKPFFYLGGYAGTGKTTVAKKLSSLQNGHTCFAAYTGKAARVLRAKGCPATTIHSLIYLPAGKVDLEIKQLEDELNDIDNPPDPAKRTKLIKRLTLLRQPSFKMNDKIPPMALLIIDEVSMVNKELAEDMLSIGVPILVLGDPGQLPPVKGAGYFTSRNPDYMLTDIHRQAAESPVLQLATKARNGESLRAGSYGTSRVMYRKEFGKDQALGVDQILCGMNKTRIVLNNEMRELKGFTGKVPLKGEKLICLQNNHKIGILNGQMFEALSDFDPTYESIDLRDDDGHKIPLTIHTECFTDPEFVNSWPYNKKISKQQFDFGYAITVHKSQGSEWPAVSMYVDGFQWDRDMFKKFLYTGITRASDRVNILL